MYNVLIVYSPENNKKPIFIDSGIRNFLFTNATASQALLLHPFGLIHSSNSFFLSPDSENVFV